MKAFVTRQLPEQALQIARAACEIEVWPGDGPPSPGELTERVDDALLEKAPKLRVVSQMAVGYDNIDVAACTRRGIAVGNTPGVLTETTADLAWALILAASRRVVEGDHYVHEGRWRTWGPMLLMGSDIHGATLGVVGLGRIGQAVAR